MDEPSSLVELGVAAEDDGWDGVVLWHPVVGTPDVAVPVSDAWVLLGALAARTEQIRLGTTITALPATSPRRSPARPSRSTTCPEAGWSSGSGSASLRRSTRPWVAARAAARWPPCSTRARRRDRAVVGTAVLLRGRHDEIEGVQPLPPPLQSPRIPGPGLGDDPQRAHPRPAASH